MTTKSLRTAPTLPTMPLDSNSSVRALGLLCCDALSTLPDCHKTQNILSNCSPIPPEVLCVCLRCITGAVGATDLT